MSTWHEPRELEASPRTQGGSRRTRLGAQGRALTTIIITIVIMIIIIISSSSTTTTTKISSINISIIISVV